MVDVRVEFRGIKEFVSGLKRINTELPRELRTEFLGVATKIAGAVALAFPHRSGRAAASVKPRAGQKGAGVAIGGAAAPYAPWLDFGGTTGRGHKGGAGKGSILRPFVPSGRYLYPTIVEKRPEIAAAATDAIVKVAHSAHFETRTR